LFLLVIVPSLTENLSSQSFYPLIANAMKSKNLRKVLNQFNAIQEGASEFEVLNVMEAGAIKGGLAACPCKRGGLTCSQTYTSG
jgi:protein-arginine kinase